MFHALVFKMEETSIVVKVLNDGSENSSTEAVGTNNETGSSLIKELKISMTNLKSNYIDEVSGNINYDKMLQSAEFLDYRRYEIHICHYKLNPQNLSSQGQKKPKL